MPPIMPSFLVSMQTITSMDIGMAKLKSRGSVVGIVNLPRRTLPSPLTTWIFMSQAMWERHGVGKNLEGKGRLNLQWWQSHQVLKAVLYAQRASSSFRDQSLMLELTVFSRIFFISLLEISACPFV